MTATTPPITDQQIAEQTGVVDVTGGSTQGEDSGDVKSKPRVSHYAVFAASDEGYKDADDALEQASWEFIGMYSVEGNGGQRAARQHALNDDANKDLLGQVEAGKRVWLFCEPAASLHPHPVELDTPAKPKVRF